MKSKEIHKYVGWYLAVKFIATFFNCFKEPLSGIVKYARKGYQIHHIEALTFRAGESSTFTVNWAFWEPKLNTNRA